MISFKDKVAIVTGGGQGIGRAIVQAFSHQGAAVVIADTDEEAGRETKDWLVKKGASADKVHFCATNVAEQSQVEKLIEEAKAKYGRIDILVNNAGISEFTKFEELSIEDWDKVINTNLRGAFLCSKLAVPHLKAHNNGCIINIASTRAMQSEAGNEAYSASKGGLISLTQAMAISLGSDIRVNSISPGWIEVRDWQKSSENQKVNHSKEQKAQHPVGRVGDPEDIGRATVFLCSGEAGFITGHNLVIDGGMTKRMIYVA
jgi:NAD(P)-dependent dehydrogenase (short-subunit alcohol dehydrogenase family)